MKIKVFGEFQIFWSWKGNTIESQHIRCTPRTYSNQDINENMFSKFYEQTFTLFKKILRRERKYFVDAEVDSPSGPAAARLLDKKQGFDGFVCRARRVLKRVRSLLTGYGASLASRSLRSPARSDAFTGRSPYVFRVPHSWVVIYFWKSYLGSNCYK